MQRRFSLGRRRSPSDQQIAVLYGLLLAAEGSEIVEAVVRLDGSPSGTYRIRRAVDDDIVVSAAAGSGPVLRGDMLAVVRSLSGQGSGPTEVLSGPADVLRSLTPGRTARQGVR